MNRGGIGTAVWTLVRETFAEWLNDRAPRLGAALAYYTVFSLAPLLIIVIAVAGLVFGEAAAQGQIVEQIEGVVGPDGARALQTMLANARQPASGLLATLLGMAMLLVAASGLVVELQDALNTIWAAPPRPGLGVLATLKDRAISLVLVIGIGFLMMVSLTLSAALAAIVKYFAHLLPGTIYVAYALQAFNFVLSVGVVTILFASIYKFLPDVAVAWRDVWVGAAATALLFTIGEFLVAVYIGQGTVGSPYGAAGSLVVLLVWVYYSAQILFFGAEFTKVYAKSYGSGLRPESDAVPVTPEARA
jgi:membrane protein